MTRFCILLFGLVNMLIGVTAQTFPKSLTLSQRRQLFAEGARYVDRQNYTSAIANLTQVVDSYPELRDYALYFLARAYLKLPDSGKALTTFQIFLAENPTHPLADDVRFTTAHLLLNAKRYAEAIPLYTHVIDRPGIEHGELYYRLGQAYQALNRVPEAISAYHQMVRFYPGHSSRKRAEEQLQALLKAAPQLTPQWTEESLWKHAQALFNAKVYTSALAQYTQFLSQYPQSINAPEGQFRMADAYFRSGQTTKGAAALEEIARRNAVQQPEIAARALYTIGSRHWNANRDAQAKTTMQQILTEYSQTSWGANASYVLGRLAQSANMYAEAAQWYTAVSTNYPAHTLAEESLWRAGWTYYLGKQYPQALQTFTQGQTLFPHGKYVEEQRYWQGRTQEYLNNSETAISIYRTLAQKTPTSYYGILAQQRLRLLKVQRSQPKQEIVSPPEFWSVFDDLRARLAPACYQMMASHIAKAIELQRIPLPQYATKELDWMLMLLDAEQNKFVSVTHAASDELRLLYFLSRLSAVAGDYLKSIQFASKLEARLDRATLSIVPYDLSALKFPLAYWDLIQTYAAANQLDPFLIAAVIRQESAYHSKALSSADARGLMQLIPETGQRTAKRVGLDNYVTAQLYDPEINIQLGTAYLASLLEKYEGDLHRAIAGYNAGPNATNKWWPPPEAEPVEPEIIIENITYPATRDYVRLVLRSQVEYRRIYGKTADPRR